MKGESKLIKKKRWICLIVCMLMLFSTNIVFGSMEANQNEKELLLDSARAIGNISVSFKRVAALKGLLEVHFESTSEPDDMYAMVMLQKYEGGRYVDCWNDFSIMPDYSGDGYYTEQKTINVSSSGTYRCMVYVYEVIGNSERGKGPYYAGSTSL